MKVDWDARRTELEQIRLSRGGQLDPAVVVEKAENPKSSLHDWFEWDETEAAYQHNLNRARKLIKVCVTVLSPDTEPVPMYVSLYNDRGAGGYRPLTEVLGDAQQRELLITQATKEFQRWELKYHQLIELADVFAAMKKVRKRRVKQTA